MKKLKILLFNLLLLFVAPVLANADDTVGNLVLQENGPVQNLQDCKAEIVTRLDAINLPQEKRIVADMRYMRGAYSVTANISPACQVNLTCDWADYPCGDNLKGVPACNPAHTYLVLTQGADRVCPEDIVNQLLKKKLSE